MGPQGPRKILRVCAGTFQAKPTASGAATARLACLVAHVVGRALRAARPILPPVTALQPHEVTDSSLLTFQSGTIIRLLTPAEPPAPGWLYVRRVGPLARGGGGDGQLTVGR